MADLPDHPEREDETHERVVLPLVIPALLFLFAVLVVYGLSRIYLDLDTWHVGDVGMATPLAIGIALLILLLSAYFAGRRAPGWQVGFVVLLAVAGLTAGATWAAVHPEPQPEHADASPTPGTPVEGGVQVALLDSPFQVTAEPGSAPAGTITFSASNTGNIIHNFRAAKTDADPASLPLDSTGFQVDETQLDIVVSTRDIPAGSSEEVSGELEEGAYVLFCNIPTHYESGMHVAFEVGPPAPGGGPPPGGEGAPADGPPGGAATPQP